jgi:hypothetical protein
VVTVVILLAGALQGCGLLTENLFPATVAFEERFLG